MNYLSKKIKNEINSEINTCMLFKEKNYLCVAFHATTISFVKACTTQQMIIYMSHSMLK
jgi:hypothetical protein